MSLDELPRASGLRTLRIVVVGLCLSVTVLTVLTVVVFVLNASRVDQINRERAANIARSCREVNERHDATIRELDRLFAVRLRGADSQSERKRAQESRDGTVLLIDALAPRRDCARLVALQVGK